MDAPEKGQLIDVLQNDIIVLSALKEGGTIITESFLEKEEALTWAEAYNTKGFNIYISVNDVDRRISKKASAKDIIPEINTLWVDIDLEVGRNETYTQAKQRQTNVVVPFIESLKPVLLMTTGNGLSAFWRYPEPVSHLEAVLTNKKLVAKEGVNGDSAATDVARIMRLDGFTNYNSKYKQDRKGYDATGEALTLFRKDKNTGHMPVFVDMTAVDGNDDKSEVTGERGRTNEPALLAKSYSKLRDGNVQYIESQGWRFKRRGGDLSKEDFSAMCFLIWATRGDQSLCMELFERSPLMRDKFKSTRYEDGRTYGEGLFDNAMKVVAGDYRLQPEDSVDRVNRQYAIVASMGGIVKLSNLKPMSVTTFGLVFKDSIATDRWGNVVMKNKGTDKEKPMLSSELWKTSDRREVYDGLVFEPSRDVRGRVGHDLNMWQGMNFIREEVQEDERSVNIVCQHIRELWCDNNEVVYNWVIDWMAQLVQYPEKKALSSIVVTGSQGTGKSVIWEMIGRFIGAHYYKASKIGDLVGNFNQALAHSVFCMVDEAIWGNDVKNTGKLKEMLVADEWNVEPKGKERYKSKNCISVAVCSNDMNPVPIESGNRRFVLLHANKKMDAGYYEELRDCCFKSEGFLAFLLDRDISNYRSYILPSEETESSKEHVQVLKLHSSSSSIQFIVDWIEDFEGRPFPDRVIKNDLRTEYLDWCYKERVLYPDKERLFGLNIKRVTGCVDGKSRDIDGVRRNCYTFIHKGITDYEVLVKSLKTNIYE